MSHPLNSGHNDIAPIKDSGRGGTKGLDPLVAMDSCAAHGSKESYYNTNTTASSITYPLFVVSIAFFAFPGLVICELRFLEQLD